MPEIDYWKTMYEETQKTSFATNLKFNLISFGAGLLLGGALGFTFGINIPIN